jgi:uncharacterized protein YbjT (DUF2867 family)
MKILVIGATGGTGQAIVRTARAQGHSVVALVRSRQKAALLEGAVLVDGDARDEAAHFAALDGCDAVISTLGTGIGPVKEITLLSQSTAALIAAMKRRGVPRLVCITGMGAGDSKGHGGFVYDWLIQPILLRKVYEDKDRQEALVRASGLDWVIVRPTVLDDKPEPQTVRALTDLAGFHGGTISRQSVARFVVEQLTEDTWLRKAPLVTA